MSRDERCMCHAKMNENKRWTISAEHSNTIIENYHSILYSVEFLAEIQIYDASNDDSKISLL